MFFETLTELENIIKNSDTSIICLEDGKKLGSAVFLLENLAKSLKNTTIIRPGTTKNTSGKPINKITIDQIREVINMTLTKQTSDFYFIFENAEKMATEAQNAALKLLEEPSKNYHFILLTTSPEALLPTIRSRAFIYTPLIKNRLEAAPEAEKAIFDLAKRLLVADNAAILDIAEEIDKKKDEKREFALKVLETTIELAEKSYFKTEKEVFTKKINGLILAYEGIKANGNLKLQLVANLV